MNDYIIIGKLIGAHGVRGEVKVFPITDDVRRFSSISECMLLSQAEKFLRTVKVTGKRITGETVLVCFDGISDRDEAQKLNGLFLSVKREEAAPLPQGRYYVSDMIGCKVSDTEHGLLGVVSDVLQTGSNDVIVVKRTGKPDLLIPYLKSVVTEVDVFSKTISAILPDGLYEIYDS